MFVERYGAGGEAYFALHGWGADHRAFAPLAPHVPAGASLYAADLPGCGRSKAPRPLTVDAVVGEVVARAAEFAPGGVTLVGLCGGAFFALLAAQRLPRAVKRVVMLDAFAYLPRYFRLFLGEGVGRRAYHATFANPFGRWLTNRSLGARRAGESDLTATFGSVDHEIAREYLRLFAEAGGVGRFEGLTTPAEIVYGERSFGAVKRSVGMWRAVLPRARVLRLKGAGHLMLAEMTEAASEIIFETGGSAARSSAGSEVAV